MTGVQTCALPIFLTSVRMSGQVGGAPDGSWGGAIHLGPGTSVVLAGRTTIRGAFAKYGGAIWAENGATVELRDRASIANGPTTGIVAGGAVYLKPGASIVLRDRASIHDNDGTAATDAANAAFGSAVDIWSYGTNVTRLTIRDEASIRGNTADAGGGGVFVWTACGDNVPILKGAKGRVTGNTPKNVVRWTVTDGC